MFSSSDHIVVNNPNRLGCDFQNAVPFAEWVEASSEEDSIDKEIASLSVKDMNLPNFFVRTTEGSFSKNAMLLNTSGAGIDSLGSCLFPKVEISTKVGEHHVVDSVSGTQNFKYDPNNEFRHFIPAHKPFHIIHFAVHPDYFFQFLPENEKWADVLKEKVAKGNGLWVSDQSISH